MREAGDPVRFKIAAARGMLDAALIASLWTQLAAWLTFGLAAGLAWGSWAGVAAACVSAAVSLSALWLLIRVAIDRRLFAALADLPAELRAEFSALQTLDQALLELGWIDATKAGRSIELRVRGVAGLLRKTVVLSSLQTLVLIAVAVYRAL
ncbi:hypothetical protein [Paraburkholderia megapolitana]|uniref:Uncharacterized protein n=1 Tax=Paraburkholderia megapolitana TaxID=420953 RepID=A0A1I3L7R3_9BURK|nr:hypothetical protein [Paraburkholderia megapolitana]QDQ80598.1 hypothetical protein FNZ07_05130 [Paraburkholderia megapolitana]SFI80771.1 hypothetical protein SAMN05192543_104285 [Paraburkholderia megapolitana]